METKMISADIKNGTIHYSDHSENIQNLEWEKHPSFKGVYIKHMIKGAYTNGLFSSHLVKLDPLCILETHNHKDQIELHEVIEGKGQFRFIEKSIDYHPGKMAVIPKGIDHRVQAGENGLMLLAKFFPAIA